MGKLTRKSKPYLGGEYDEIFNTSQTNSLTEEEAVAYSQSYLRELEHERAVRFASARSLDNVIKARLLNEPLDRISSL